MPCDEDGNVLEEPEQFEAWLKSGNYFNASESVTHKCRMYRKSKEKVLFNGWFMHFEDCVFKLKDGALSIMDFDSNYTIEDFCENDEESRILTTNALKQLGL